MSGIFRMLPPSLIVQLPPQRDGAPLTTGDLMRSGPMTRVLTAATVCLAAVGALTGSAAAATGPGSWTTITVPSSDVHFLYDEVTPSNNTLPVSGTTSNDVSAVNIVCFYSQNGSVSSTTLASNVSVVSGSFSTTATITSSTANCRLRAVPDDWTSTDYLASFTGPVLYFNAMAPSKDAGNTVYSYIAYAEQGDGYVQTQDAGGTNCGGGETMVTIQRPAMTLGPVSERCSFTLPYGNDPSGTSSRSTIQVDGFNAYLPSGVANFLIGVRGLPVSQSALTVTKSLTSSGDFLVTESAPLMRCNTTLPNDVYPPTSGSCSSVVASGVTFQRTRLLFRNGHQIRVRETFASTDGQSHVMNLDYRMSVTAPSTGQAGYMFPGQSAFSASTLDQTVTSLGTKAGTMLVRSDLRAASDDERADTMGYSWSRPPSVVVFGHTDPNTFVLRYSSLSVPAGGTTFLGFANSESLATSSVQSLAAQAVADMMAPPTITSPANAAKVPTQSTTVKGALTAGANGLPTSVLVNGHAAALKKTSATTATYTVTFTQAWGAHKVTVVAKDAVGNSASKAITVTNTPALHVRAKPTRSGTKLSVPLACGTWASTTCYGKLVIKSSSGATLAASAAFAVSRGGTKTVTLTMKTTATSVRVYLYQKEPNGTYPLASYKAYSV